MMIKKKSSVVCFLLLFFLNVEIFAKENSLFLFGIDLEKATRAELREAIKGSGAKVLFEEESKFGDKYETSHILKGSYGLEIVYTDSISKDFSSATYFFPFNGDNKQIYEIKEMLEFKYGQANKEIDDKSGKFLCRWIMTDNLLVELVRNGFSKETYLGYTNVKNTKIKEEQIAKIKEAEKQAEYQKNNDLF